MRYFTLKTVVFSLFTLTLGACSTYRDIPTNSPEARVYQQLGQPTHRCEIDSHTTRLIWSTQPMGQYAYAGNLSHGVIDKIESILNTSSFRQLDKGEWTQKDVLCTFGPPAEIGRIGLGEKNEVVWSYRYKESNYWNNLMYVYFGHNGDKVTRYHSGPDPLYEREFWFDY